jgi:hypothetical protein
MSTKFSRKVLGEKSSRILGVGGKSITTDLKNDVRKWGGFMCGRETSERLLQAQ